MERLLKEIHGILVPLWPDARPLLDYGSPFELLCSVILSAQCTDEQVNRVTPGLFARFPDAAAMAAADVAEVETLVHSVGFFRTKARHLVMTAGAIMEEYGGEVPGTMEGLLRLPGVGRKTANLVASACFSLPGIVVDTHVLRVAYRLGIDGKKDPASVESTIAANLAPEFRTAFSHALNRHGKFTCTARKPACVRDRDSGAGGGGLPCPIEHLCPKIGVAAAR